MSSYEADEDDYEYEDGSNRPRDHFDGELSSRSGENHVLHVEVSINGDTPKWMVYNRKCRQNG